MSEKVEVDRLADDKTKGQSFNLLDEDLARQMVDDALQGTNPEGLTKLLMFLEENTTDLGLRNTLDMLMRACFCQSHEHSRVFADYLKQCKDSPTAAEKLHTI